MKGQVQTEKRRGGEEKKGVRKGRKGLIEKERSEKEWLEKETTEEKGPKLVCSKLIFFFGLALFWTLSPSAGLGLNVSSLRLLFLYITV